MKEGYLEPELKYPLRNSKEIVEFENSLAPKEKANLDTLRPISDLGAESLLLPSKEEPSSSITLVQPYELPTQNWPMSVLELPQNMCQAQEVHVEVHDKAKGPLKNAIKLCLDKLPSKRVLIVVFSEIISSELIDLIKEIRGDRRPLVVDKKNKLGKNPQDINEYEIIIRKWLVNQAKKRPHRFLQCNSRI